MPIYEYKCEQCEAEFEELVFGDGVPPCPKCASEKTHKLMSCCRYANASGEASGPAAAGGGGGGCAGCSGGSCATCH